MQTTNLETPLKRIAVFYDGSFFQRINLYYAYHHPRKQFLDMLGLHEYIRQRVAQI